MKKLVKPCLHLDYIVQNSFHFDEIFFHGKFQNFKIPILAILTLILGNIGTKIDLYRRTWCQTIHILHFSLCHLRQAAKSIIILFKIVSTERQPCQCIRIPFLLFKHLWSTRCQTTILVFRSRMKSVPFTNVCPTGPRHYKRTDGQKCRKTMKDFNF